MIVFIFLSPPYCTLDIFSTENTSIMEVNTNWKYLQIFIFMGLKRPLNWLKHKITKTEENVNENDHVSDLCKNASRKINAIARVAPYTSNSKRRILMSAFFKSKLNCCPLVWMCHSQINNTKTSSLHENASE